MRLLLALICALAVAGAAESNPLTGTKWAITIVSGEGDKTEDVLSFEGATLASQAYAESRFIPGPVTVTGTAEKCTLAATLAEPLGRELALRGTVTGSTIEGTIAVGVRGQYERSTFTGKKQ